MSLNSIILNSAEKVSLEDAYHRLQQHFGKQEGYLNTGNWGKKFKEIKRAEEWKYEDSEMIARIFLVVFVCLILAALCIPMSLAGGSRDPFSGTLFFLGSINGAVAASGFLLGLPMIINNAIAHYKHEKIKPILSQQLDQEKVNEIVNEILAQ